jgi:hypothetical protein
MGYKFSSLRMIRSFLITLCLFAVSATTVKSHAQKNGGRLSDLDFIVGHWKATTTDRTVEGQWMAQDGDNMLGVMRMMNGNKAAMYELLAYEQSEQGLVSRVKHFKPGMIGVEEKDKHDQYNFLEAVKGKATFQKEGEDLRIIYEKRSENQFVIQRGNLVDGKWMFKDLFVFDRVK